MSSSIAASTVRRRARVPSRWPSATGSPRDIAQRPLPSRMIATQPTGSGGSSGARGLRNRSSRPTEASDFEDLLLFAFEEVVDLVGVVVRQLLDALFGPVFLVAADLALVHELLQVVHDVSADVPDSDTSVLRHLPRDLDELLAALLGQLWDRQADDLAVVRRGQAEVGLLDRPLDRRQRARVERLHRQQPGLRRVDRGQLVERRLGAVVIDLDPVEQSRRGAARSQGVELVLGGLDGFVHPAGRVVNELVDGHLSAPEFGVETMVPTRSPSTTRRMLPSASAKTWIGR